VSGLADAVPEIKLRHSNKASMGAVL